MIRRPAKLPYAAALQRPRAMQSGRAYSLGRVPCQIHGRADALPA
jgi:hypothetical protein